MFSVKKIIKFSAAFTAASFLLGLAVSAAEKQKEKRDSRSREAEKTEHRFYGYYERQLKRPLDFALALLALTVSAPVLLLVALSVKVKLGSPVIFTQERPGKDEQIFRLYKFRTMTDERGADGKLLSDEERLTDFGKWLRATSLDELPELFNILKGDMSLVGPRPLLVAYLPRYNKRQARRHEVRPGLTGLAQVSGRNSLSWEEKFEDDVAYVERITFMGDLKILIRTFLVVFERTGISSATSVTMEEFRGSEQSGA